jgi:hypothetical protein
MAPMVQRRFGDEQRRFVATRPPGQDRSNFAKAVPSLLPLITKYQQLKIDVAYSMLKGMAVAVEPPEQLTMDEKQSPATIEGQRRRAVAALQQSAASGPFTCAAVALVGVEPFYAVMGEMGAGEIGDHYLQDIPDILASVPTDNQLWAMAQRETEFWNSARGSFIGAQMTAEERYGLLLKARKEWEDAMPAETRSAWDSIKSGSSEVDPDPATPQ